MADPPASFRPSTNDAPPSQPPSGSMAARMSAEGDSTVEPPASTQGSGSKVPVFANAKLRPTAGPFHSQRGATSDSQQPPPPPSLNLYSQTKLRSTSGGVAVDTRAAPQQELNEKKAEPEDPPATAEDPPAEQKGVVQQEPVTFYPENPQYERVLLSRQEPEVVTQHKVMTSEPEYEVVEYKMCCTIL